MARAFGRVFRGRSGDRSQGPGKTRVLDLLIAATALAASLPLYTRSPGDFEGLTDLLEVSAVELAG